MTTSPDKGSTVPTTIKTRIISASDLNKEKDGTKTEQGQAAVGVLSSGDKPEEGVIVSIA